MSTHGNRDIARRLRLISGERKLSAIDSGINVVGRRKTNSRGVEKEAVIPKMVVRIVNADIKQNPAEQLLTIARGVYAVGSEKIN